MSPNTARIARSLAVAGAVVGVVAGVAACGTTDGASQERLPPIRTTVASTSTTSTTIPPGQRFYTVNTGDTLEVIAQRFEVTVEAIVAANGLENPDDIQAGQTIEIPAIVVIEELPDGPAGGAATTAAG